MKHSEKTYAQRVDLAKVNLKLNLAKFNNALKVHEKTLQKVERNGFIVGITINSEVVK